MKLLDKVITMLQNDIPLEEKYRDHELKGKYQGFKECHIQPDWLLIYLKENDVLTLTLVDYWNTCGFVQFVAKYANVFYSGLSDGKSIRLIKI